MAQTQLRQRKDPDGSGMLASFNGERRVRKVLLCCSISSHCCCRRCMFNGRHFNFRQLSDNFNISTGMSLLAFYILTYKKQLCCRP